jgi:O-antigen ligase
MKVILICPFFMMGLYLFHVIMGPLSLQGTVVEFMKWGLYSHFAILAYSIGRTDKGKIVLQVGWHMMGALLTTSALLTVYGVIDIPFSIIHTDNLGISATGARLAGLLQYPNTFAAIMAAFLLERLFALAPLIQRHSSARSALLGTLPLLPYTAALLLSESRGAWLAAGFAVAAGLVLERRRLTPPLLLAAAPVAGAAVLYRQLTDVQLAPPLGPGLMWLAGLWAGSVLVGLGLWRLWQSHQSLTSAAALSNARSKCLSPHESTTIFHAPAAECLIRATVLQDSAAECLIRATVPQDSATESRMRAIVPPNSATDRARFLISYASNILPRARAITSLSIGASLWMIGVVAVWTTVQERLIANFGTVSARGIIYRDAWRLVQQSPWIGQGGYTWRWSYPAIQSQPYVGSEVHNGYLDMLLNTGLLGLIIVMILLLAGGTMLLKNNRVLLPSYLVLILHSAVDFDWSYSLSWILLFWLMAWGVAAHAISDDYSELNVEPILNRRPRSRIIPVVMIGLWLVTTVGLITLAFRGEMGSRLYRQASHTINRSSSQAMLRASLQWNPANVETALALGQQASTEQERIQVLRNSLSYAPNHPRLVWEVSKAYGAMGHINSYVDWLNKGLSLDPYNVNKWSQSLETIYQLSQTQRHEGNIYESRLLVETGAEMYLKYQELLDEVNQHKGYRNDRDFKLTDEATNWGNKLAMLAQTQRDP